MQRDRDPEDELAPTSTVFFAVNRVSSTAIAAATIRKNSKKPRVGNSIAVQPAPSDRGETLILGKANSLPFRGSLPNPFYRLAQRSASEGIGRHVGADDRERAS